MPEDKPTILVVEDDVDVAEMLNAYFRVQGFEVQAVNRGEEVIGACHKIRPDLIILDIRLPDMDGYEVARRLRSNRRTEAIPIIFLTEKRERVDRLQGLELGADDYVTKPFDIQELRLRVRNALHRTTQSSLTNPVTGLAEGPLLDERLNECLENGDWALLLVSIENLDAFREAYGFVASDDVQRAVGLMVHNAVRDIGNSADFIGQLSPSEFILVTTPTSLPVLSERISTRVNQSLDYFYPLKDLEGSAIQEKKLVARLSRLLAGEGSFSNPDELKIELRHRG